MAIALKSSCFFQVKKPEAGFPVYFSSKKAIISVKRNTPVAAIRTMETVGLSETFSRLKKQGKVRAYSMFSIVSHVNLNSMEYGLPTCFFNYN